MSTPQVITLEGVPVVRFELHVPNVGVWFADCKLNTQKTLSGKVQIKWGDNLTLLGTIDPTYSDSFVIQSTYRVVGGGNGWGKVVTRKGYHADNGVSTNKVAQEAAKEVGETIGIFQPSEAKFASDYLRRTCQAARVLEDCAGGQPWWVDFDGSTNVGPRPTSTPSKDQYHLLDFDPIAKELSLGLEAAPYDGDETIVIGSIITDDRLESPLTVRELLIISEGSSLTCKAWTDDDSASTYSRLAKTFKNLVNRSTDEKLFGKWRYRVLDVASDGRVNLQVVSKESPVPNAILVPQSPGFGGVHVEYTPGAIVHVEFLEGNLELPRITGAENWSPSSQDRDPNSYPVSIELGGPGTQSPVAIAGSWVQSGGTLQYISFSDAAGVPVVLCYPTTPPTPASPPYLVSFGQVPPTLVSAQPLMGAVMDGSNTVKVGPP